MNWISVKDKLPPYHLEVLAWKECERCRNNDERHEHWVDSNHPKDVFITSYQPGNNSSSGEPFWSRYDCDYWCYMVDPITNLGITYDLPLPIMSQDMKYKKSVIKKLNKR